ncbi:MAG TPA: hypothetical protein VMW87_09675 [Spirochaetia bacterium]|nr:hypothetical protein [Spirochaetia bacterium]
MNLEPPKRPYSLQMKPTTKKSRHFIYLKFRDTDTGKYLVAVSSGMTSKSAAANWADEQIKSGSVLLPGKRNMPFGEFVGDFWDFEKSEYIRGKLARGQQIGRSHAKTSAGYITRHVLPYFGERKLVSIRTVNIDRWMMGLLEKGDLSAKSISLVHAAFRTMPCEAHPARYGLAETDKASASARR